MPNPAHGGACTTPAVRLKEISRACYSFLMRAMQYIRARL